MLVLCWLLCGYKESRHKVGRDLCNSTGLAVKVKHPDMEYIVQCSGPGPCYAPEMNAKQKISPPLLPMRQLIPTLYIVEALQPQANTRPTAEWIETRFALLLRPRLLLIINALVNAYFSRSHFVVMDISISVPTSGELDLQPSLG